MTHPRLGTVAPSFRLPSAQGPEVALDDFRGQKNVILWFTKGMSCPFCRQHMSQLGRARDRFTALDTELLAITPSPVDRARAYARKFPLPFAYLCDPEDRAGRAFGLEVRSHSLAWYAKALLEGSKRQPPPSEFGQDRPPLGEMPMLLRDDDLGFFIVDRDGVIRFALQGSYVAGAGARPIPSNEEIVRELERCRDLARGA